MLNHGRSLYLLSTSARKVTGAEEKEPKCHDHKQEPRRFKKGCSKVWISERSDVIPHHSHWCSGEDGGEEPSDKPAPSNRVLGGWGVFVFHVLDLPRRHFSAPASRSSAPLAERKPYPFTTLIKDSRVPQHRSEGHSVAYQRGPLKDRLDYFKRQMKGLSFPLLVRS